MQDHAPIHVILVETAWASTLSAQAWSNGQLRPISPLIARQRLTRFRRASAPEPDLALSPRPIKTLPAPVLNELTQLGSAVRRSRVARNESQNALAQRLGIAERTLRAVEKGDATVSVGVFISALWAVGLRQLSVPIT
jgi:DNA-binding XRE family transcriptional regulator